MRAKESLNTLNHDHLSFASLPIRRVITHKNIRSKGQCKGLMQIRTEYQGLERTCQVNYIEHLKILSL